MAQMLMQKIVTGSDLATEKHRAPSGMALAMHTEKLYERCGNAKEGIGVLPATLAPAPDRAGQSQGHRAAQKGAASTTLERTRNNNQEHRKHAMTFEESLDQAIAMLRHRRRVTYRTL